MAELKIEWVIIRQRYEIQITKPLPQVKTINNELNFRLKGGKKFQQTEYFSLF